MKINLNTAIYNTNLYQTHSNYQSSPINTTFATKSSSVSFYAAIPLQKTVSSKITHEKTKLLSHIKNILVTDVPVLTTEEKLYALMQKAHNLMKMKERRLDEIEQELTFLGKDTTMNPQQKLNRISQLKKEFNKLEKLKIIYPAENKTNADNFDYSLINKFKEAVMNDNYDFSSIYEEHYQELNNVQTIEEFKEKYPSIRIPKDPRDVIVQKIIATLNRNFYLEFNKLFNDEDKDQLASNLASYYTELFTQISPLFGNKSVDEIYTIFGHKLTLAILSVFEDIKLTDSFKSIPETRISKLPNITDTDLEMFNIDYDKFVLTTLRQHYLEGKKLNQIEYSEGDKKININSIKQSEYKFEKQPEKIKVLISDARKIAQLQRNYQNFTPSELKDRLYYYAKTESGNHEDILKLIVDFDGCKFTEEDTQYLIKFLTILDNVTDKQLSLEQALETIRTNNIFPHGTLKLNDIERKKIEEQIKIEQELNKKLNILRQEFDNAVNSLYQFRLMSLIPSFAKFYPETYDEISIQKAKDTIKLIQDCIKLNEPAKIKTAILRNQIFNEYLETNPNTEIFKQALSYTKNYSSEEVALRGGQYILNREIVDNYPESLELTPHKTILQKIMSLTSSDNHSATIALCKYENYYDLDKQSKQSIFNILDIFDIKNNNEKAIIKYIIENDYLNTDTDYNGDVKNHNFKSTISTTAKQGIYEKYKFPKCIDLFKEFEEAIRTTAGENGMSGIKKISTNNNAMAYNAEVKIMGYPDRLFSGQNNYYFDIYSEKGFH